MAPSSRADFVNGLITNPFPEKPKYMHWRTYERLERMADEAVDEINVYTVQRFGGLVRAIAKSW